MNRVRLLLVFGSWIALTPAFLYLPSFGQFTAGIWLGVGIGLYLDAREEGPSYIERWREGRDGERATGRMLRKLKRDSWRSFHDLADGEHWNLDHISIGPGGVFLIDSKRRRGTLSVDDGVLSCHYEISPQSDYSMPRQPGHIAAAAGTFEKRLEKELGWIPDVLPVMALWADFPVGEADIGHVAIVRGDRLADWLRRQPNRLAEADREAIARVVEGFPRAT